MNGLLLTHGIKANTNQCIEESSRVADGWQQRVQSPTAEHQLQWSVPCS